MPLRKYWISEICWPCAYVGANPTAPTIEVIKKIKSKYVVLSESTGRSFGSYKTKKEAINRLQQVEFFKHLKSSPGLKRKLKKKSLIRPK